MPCRPRQRQPLTIALEIEDKTKLHHVEATCNLHGDVFETGECTQTAMESRSRASSQDGNIGYLFIHTLLLGLSKDAVTSV